MKDSRLLKEWVYLGNRTTANSTSAADSAVDYIEKFKKLIPQLKTTFSDAKVVRLKSDEFYMSFGNNKGSVLIRFSDDGTTDDRFTIYIEHTLRIMFAPERYRCDSWDAVLDILVAEKVISDKTLCESVSKSVIDDFKLYKNLWD